MARVPLVYAGGAYWDRTRPLMDGTVRPEGIDLTYIELYPPELWRRMISQAEARPEGAIRSGDAEHARRLAIVEHPRNPA